MGLGLQLAVEGVTGLFCLEARGLGAGGGRPCPVELFAQRGSGFERTGLGRRLALVTAGEKGAGERGQERQGREIAEDTRPSAA